MQSGKWGREVDFNLFTTSEADRLKFAANGCDANSLTGDPLFTSREAGDYQVKGESPAIKLGFQNFSMDDFGVQKPELKGRSHAEAAGQRTTATSNCSTIQTIDRARLARSHHSQHLRR